MLVFYSNYRLEIYNLRDKKSTHPLNFSREEMSIMKITLTFI